MTKATRALACSGGVVSARFLYSLLRDIEYNILQYKLHRKYRSQRVPLWGVSALPCESSVFSNLMRYI